jgi:hypothetical protein
VQISRTKTLSTPFIRYCYKGARRDFGGSEISVSSTTPEDITQGGIKAGVIGIYKP